MTPALQKKKLTFRESLSNLPKIGLRHVAEMGFKHKSKTESSVHNSESSAT